MSSKPKAPKISQAEKDAAAKAEAELKRKEAMDQLRQTEEEQARKRGQFGLASGLFTSSAGRSGLIQSSLGAASDKLGV